MIRIFCDMDGVLTNFVGRCQELLSIDIFKHQEKYGMESIWPYINKYGYKFWTQINWMPDGQKLWHYLRQFPNTVIITAIPSYKASRYPKQGKNAWIDANLGVSVFRRIGRRRDKVKDARFGYILIDDYEKTVQEWRERGGIGIVHKSADATIAQLETWRKECENTHGLRFE